MSAKKVSMKCGVLRLCSVAGTNNGTSGNRPSSTLASYKRGRGGRSSFNGLVATVFGATSFLGRYVVNQLGKMGTQVVIAYRGPEYDVEHHKVAGDLGQILFSPYNLRDEASIQKAMQHSNVVINLVGRDWETRNFSYEDVHVDGAARIARLAAEKGVERFVHMSALNASEEPERTVSGNFSRFLQTKALGELAVRQHFPDAIIFRPADMWGEEDRFIHYWTQHWRQHLECLPLWQRGETTVKQPVDVANVAQGIVKAIIDKNTDGATFECVGPKSYYQCDMLDFFYDEIRAGPPIKLPVNLPSFLLKAKICEMMFPTNPRLVTDKLYREAATDRLTGCATLEDLGVKLSDLETGARYQLKIRRRDPYYAEALHEIRPADPPLTASAVDQARKVYY